MANSRATQGSPPVSSAPSGGRKVVVIGGGLAGMTVAKELAKRKVPVVILEASANLGGKAGSTPRAGDQWEDHAYHIFPGWYENTRSLLREIGCDRNLIDLSMFHSLRKGDFPSFISIREASSVTNMLRNLFSGMLPWYENLLAYYFIIDLAAASFDDRAYLDRVSGVGFLRSRFYATDAAATSLHQSALQGSSIPLYDLSAMTLRKVSRLWAMRPSPFVSILNGSLQEAFIGPYERYLKELGVQIHPHQHVKHLVMSDDRVGGVAMTEGDAAVPMSPDDIFVLAVPPAIALQCIDRRAIETEWQPPSSPADSDRLGLADLAYLRSAPMAAWHLQLKRTIPDIPEEPVFLLGSRFGTSFLDVAPHWGLKGTKLHLIAANFEPLRCLPAEEAKQLLLRELVEYVPTIRMSDLPDDLGDLQPHVEQPLFLNTVAAWHFRPETTTGVANLFVAGDYCRTQADLTTMESAVMSGINTAGAILRFLGRRSGVRAQPLAEPSWLPLQLAKYAALPVVLPVAFGSRVLGRLRSQWSDWGNASRQPD